MTKEKQEKIVEFMIRLYCKKQHKHKHELCAECQELHKYVRFRTSKCPHGQDKPFCSNCKIHCYKPDMSAKIKNVMRFSGPRLMLYHPIVAIKHVRATIKFKKQIKKERNNT